MMYILSFNILTHNIPAIPNASMETARRPHMLTAPFPEMREFFPVHITTMSFTGSSALKKLTTNS
jgi:hypothetical protein